MDTAIIVALIGALLGGSGITATILTLCLKRKFEKEDRQDEIKATIQAIRDELNAIKEEILESQRDRKRQQLLTLMYHDPTNIDTIMAVAKVYFKKLDGNWYMDSQFSQWMKEQGVEPPSWFKGK